MIKSCVIYARFSSSAQRDASIEQQERTCRAYAARNNMSVLHIYADHAITGRTDQRPEFQRMIKDAASSMFWFIPWTASPVTSMIPPSISMS